MTEIGENATPTRQTPGVDARDGFLRVYFDGKSASHADFHYFWLRHNCDCCRHPETGERTLCSSRVPLEIRPTSVVLDPDGVSLTLWWLEESGRHRSEFALAWLQEHAYAEGRGDVPPPSGELSKIEVDARRLPSEVQLRDICQARIVRYGAIVVRGAGTDTEAIIAELASGGWQVIETHFGRIEDLRTDNVTNLNTDQLGYTDSAVDLHTDQPFIEKPPRYQMLNCIRPADEGGASFVADGWQAARHLQSVDAYAFELLTSTPVVFDRRQREFESVMVAPIIELRDSEIVQIRSSYFTVAPHRVPFEVMEQWYRAYARFAGIVGDPRHQFRFELAAGDFLLYDNYRMLHARSGFRGARWVRGVYFDVLGDDVSGGAPTAAQSAPSSGRPE